MKSFNFRLEQALHWRQTQLSLQKSRVAAAVGQLSGIETQLEQLRAELSGAAGGIGVQATGGSLQSWAGFRDRARVRIRDFESQAQIVRRTIALETKRMIEANRKVQLVENLKRNAMGKWQKELDRELTAFSDEAFLARMQSESRRQRGSARTGTGVIRPETV